MLKLRFGLSGENEHTLEQVAQQFNVTRERIRQIQSQLEQRLANKPMMKCLTEEGAEVCYQQYLHDQKAKVRTVKK